MQQLDDRILEHLAEESWSSPKVMHSLSAFRASEARIAERCRVLASVGFLAQIHGSSYEITGWGKQYLEGALDANHQWPPLTPRD
ncbi:MAG: hypothetical protein U5K37_10280 [Natrialbaceae archaeon]|nr:hypothetical protein [Natrialbaceae archaeon]